MISLARSRTLRFSFLGVAITLLVIRLWPHPPLSELAPTSTAVMSADKQLLRLTLAPDQQYRVWTQLNAISPTLIDAVQLHEDRWFYWHPGVNPIALLRGAARTYGFFGYGSGNRQGGSTLTMQLARLAYNLNTRTPGGKIRQVGYALWLEARYGKRELLEAYLNLAPYGGNVQGVGAASLIYFGKPADQLTLTEALTLAVIPQQPNRRGGKNHSADALQKARVSLFNRWQQNHDVSSAEAHLAVLPLPLRDARQLPFRAPHFVDALLAKHIDQLPPRLQTTLDWQLQQLVERQTRLYIAQRRSSGVRNAVALLIDPRDMGVKAWLGSADYFDKTIDGQVNGVLAKRSPGSTLKPFIYALAIDQGLIHPRTILKDAPVAFGPFAPENFDGRFIGPITAQDALIHSRNVPAVWVAAQLRNPGLYQFLQSAGISNLQSEQHYGLALVLGGGEVTMEESAGLYAMLMNQGQQLPLSYLQSDLKKQSETSAPGPQLISPEASFITLDMLAHNPRPDGVASSFTTEGGGDARWPVAWKTGTSWGFRDAWSVGAVGPYVLAVWIGNFDGTGNPAFVGVDTAAPLFFRIADALRLARPRDMLKKIISPPADVKRVAVCAASGDLPNQWCTQLEPTWYIPGKSPIKVSTLHRPVAIDIRNNQPVCPPYDPQRVRYEIYEFWSSDMLRLFRQAGMPRRAPPHCDSDRTGFAYKNEAPSITSPLREVTYTLRTSRPDERIALQATAAGTVKTLYWFSGNRFLGRANPPAPLAWRPDSEGIYDLRVVDDRGQTDERSLRVAITR
jgi:penicillin-binding protein 1C